MFGRRTRAFVFAAVAALSAACGQNASGSGQSPATSEKPAKMTFEVVLLDDAPDPFNPLPEGAPKGISTFQELIVNGPESIDTRTFVRLVVQPGETLEQARTRAKPWFDQIKLPPGDRLLFQEITEENEVTKKREGVGVRTFIGTSTVVLTRDDVGDATLGVSPDQEEKPQPVAMIQLAAESGKRFQKFTAENVLKRLGVLIDGKVVMAARIQEEIAGGKISISLDPEIPYEPRRAELERIVNGIRPGGAPPPLPPK